MSILEKNQCPPAIHNPVVRKTLNYIITADKPKQSRKSQKSDDKIFALLQSRGSVTEKCSEINLLWWWNSNTIYSCYWENIRQNVSALKEPVPLLFRSRVEITCVGCNALYVGQTVHHHTTRLRQHYYKTARVRQHLDAGSIPKSTIPSSTKSIESSYSLSNLLSLETLRVSQLRQSVNIRNKVKSNDLLMRFRWLEWGCA